MDDKKTVEDKFIAQAEREAYQNELANLNNRKEKLEEKLREKAEEKTKAFHVRNLRVIKNTGNVLIPYVVCVGIAIGSFCLFGKGLPLKKDIFKRSLCGRLKAEEQTQCPILKTNYISKLESVLSEDTSGKITIWSPWEEKDGIFIRYKREYEISENGKDIVDSILKNEYDQIIEQLEFKKEETEIVSYQPPEEEFTSYSIKGNIYFQDIEDTITVPESDYQNFIVTLLEAILGLGSGALIACKRDFEYFYEIKDNNSDYRYAVRIYNEKKAELESVEQEIYNLKKRGRI